MGSFPACTHRRAGRLRFLEAQRGVHRLAATSCNSLHANSRESAANRRYLTFAIGCTGGRHRSVYLAERIAERLSHNYPVIAIRHNSLGEMRSITRAPTLAGAHTA